MKEILLPWPEWRVDKILGRGAFGEVYQVVREEFGNKIFAAVKIIRIPAEESEIHQLEDSGISAKSYLKSMIEDITNEIVVMHTLKGAPNIVSIEDYKIVESTKKIQWTIYIRMELLQDLNKYKKNQSLTFEQMIRVGCDICNALEICKRKKIVHRDIKPSNIFVSPYGEFKLGDFGISKHTENTKSGFSTRKGTGSYMAPEIYRGVKYDYTVDIYSLGIVLFQLANNGRLPFYPPYGMDVLPEDAARAFEKRTNGEPFPDPENGGKALGDIIRKACHIDPKQRYQSPKEMQEELKKLLSETDAVEIGMEEEVSDSEDETKTIIINEPVEKEPQTKNHYKMIIVTVAALLGIGTISALWFFQMKKPGKILHTDQTTVIETETEEAKTKMETETKEETETETKEEIETETEIETKEETETETEIETKEEIETETETEIKEETETEEKTRKIVLANAPSENDQKTMVRDISDVDIIPGNQKPDNESGFSIHANNNSKFEIWGYTDKVVSAEMIKNNAIQKHNFIMPKDQDLSGKIGCMIYDVGEFEGKKVDLKCTYFWNPLEINGLNIYPLINIMFSSDGFSFQMTNRSYEVQFELYSEGHPISADFNFGVADIDYGQSCALKLNDGELYKVQCFENTTTYYCEKNDYNWFYSDYKNYDVEDSTIRLELKNVHSFNIIWGSDIDPWSYPFEKYCGEDESTARSKIVDRQRAFRSAVDNGSLDELKEIGRGWTKIAIIDNGILDLCHPVSYNGHKYKLYDNGLYREKAKEYCEHLGGHLATIGDISENKFLHEYIQSLDHQSAYFGFTDMDQEGTWKWVNGEEILFINWADGEPNGENGGEDYAQFYWEFEDGRWNDGDFGLTEHSGGYAYICEWDS